MVGRIGALPSAEAVAMGVFSSGGSEEGGSSPMLGFNGVRKGDLNGFWSVLVASFSRRRLACGVDILSTGLALVLAVMATIAIGVLVG